MFVASENEGRRTWGPFTTSEAANRWLGRLVVATGEFNPEDAEGTERADLIADYVNDNFFVEEVESVDEDDVYLLDYRTYSYRKTFGPGSLESVELFGYKIEDPAPAVVRLVRGRYRVYCGAGNEHLVPVDSGPLDEAAFQAYRSLVDKTDLDDEALTFNTVSMIVNEIVNEEFLDPCEATDLDDEEALHLNTLLHN